MDNEKHDESEKSDKIRLRPEISNVVTAVLITAAVCCAGAAFFMNRYINKDEDEPFKIYYSSSATESSPVQTTTVRTTTAETASEKSVSSTGTKAVKTSATAQTSSVKPEYTFPADINSVDAMQLTAITGIGDITAQKIIDFRSANGKIRNMEMLLEIDGIGQSTLELLEQYLYVSAADYSEITRQTLPPETTVSSRTTKKTTTAAPTTTTAAPVTTVTEAETPTSTTVKSMKSVNINKASAQELADCLLLDTEMAQAIVELRTKIQYFSRDLELLYVDGFSEQMLAERRPYITLS